MNIYMKVYFLYDCCLSVEYKIYMYSWYYMVRPF